MAETRSDRPLWGLLVVGLIAGAEASAQAQTAEGEEAPWNRPLGSAWERAPWGLELHLGLGTPLGYLGVALDWSLLEWASIGGGVGVGSGRDGGSAHVALGGRVRPVRLGSSRLTLGVDYSTGGWQARKVDAVGGLFPSHGSGSGDQDPPLYAERLHWVQPAVGIEQRFESGALLRLYTGVGVLLNPGDIRCERASGQRCQVSADERAPHKAFPFVGGALGVAF